MSKSCDHTLFLGDGSQTNQNKSKHRNFRNGLFGRLYDREQFFFSQLMRCDFSTIEEPLPFCFVLFLL